MTPRKDASASLAAEGPGFLGLLWWSPPPPKQQEEEVLLLGSAPRCVCFLASPAARDGWWGGERCADIAGRGGEALTWGRARGGLACAPARVRARGAGLVARGEQGKQGQGGRVGWEGIAGLGLAARRARAERAAEDFRSGFVCWTLAGRQEERVVDGVDTSHSGRDDKGMCFTVRLIGIDGGRIAVGP